MTVQSRTIEDPHGRETEAFLLATFNQLSLWDDLRLRYLGLGPDAVDRSAALGDDDD